MTWNELEIEILRGPIGWVSFLQRLCQSMYSPFFLWIWMWNGLLTLPINEREGKDGGGEDTSAKEENGGR